MEAKHPAVRQFSEEGWQRLRLQLLLTTPTAGLPSALGVSQLTQRQVQPDKKTAIILID